MMSLVMWQLIYDCLPVDARISYLGIPMVSKCNYCVEGHVEDRDHVLNSSNGNSSLRIFF